MGIERHIRLVADLLDPEPRHLAAPSSARGEGQEQNGQITGIDEAVRPACREQPVEHVARDGRLLLRWRGRTLARTASRRAAQRLGAWNGPSLPFPAMQRAPSSPTGV
jgi:hypothetical protein